VANLKQLLGTKLEGVCIGQHPNKFGTPYLSLQPLKLAPSNLVYNFGLVSSLPIITFRAKINKRGPGWEHPKKLWNPILISITIEASNFKFGIHFWFDK